MYRIRKCNSILFLGDRKLEIDNNLLYKATGQLDLKVYKILKCDYLAEFATKSKIYLHISETLSV